MPVNYRVDGGVNVTPAIPPARHDWSMLERQLNNAQAYKAKKAAEEEAAKMAKAKQAADEAKYNPDGVKDLDYNDLIHKKGMEVLDYSANSFREGTTGSPEHNYNIGKKRQEAELMVGKANAAIETYKSAYQNVDQLPPYVDKNQLNKQIYEAAHPKKENGELDFDAIDPKAISEIPANYYGAINTADMYGAKMKSLGEKVHSKEVMFPVTDPNDGTALGQMIRSDSTKARFFRPVMDEKGRVKQWVPGVTNEAAEFLMNNDQEIRGEAEDKLNQYIIAEAGARAAQGDTRDPREIYNDVKRDINAQEWMVDHVKMNMERLNETSTQQSYKQGYKYNKPDGEGDDEDFKATKMIDQKRTINIRQPGAKEDDIQTGDVPEEYRFSGKKLDQPVLVNSTKIYDENTNNTVTGQESIGDKKFYPTRTMLMAYDTKTGKYVHGSTEKLKTAPSVVYKWVVGGKLDATQMDDEGKEKKIQKNVFMPYDEISNDIKAKYGFDLNDRDMSELSDLELTSLVKEQYPNASAQKRLEIFKKLRSQK